MNAQLHTIFTGLAIVVLGYGAFLRLRWHPLYSHYLLLNGLFYAVWSGLIVAWLPNLVAPAAALLFGEPIPMGWWQSGLDNWMLGVAGGFVAAYFYVRAHNLPLLFILDAVAPVLALTLVIVRVGCAIHADAYGKVTDSWVAMWLPDVYGTYAWRYPTQYASIVANLLIAALLFAIERGNFWRDEGDKPKKVVGGFPSGLLFILYVLLYSLQRFFFEFWRGDKYLIAGPFTMTHVYCALATMLAIWGWWQLVRARSVPPIQTTFAGEIKPTK